MLDPFREALNSARPGQRTCRISSGELPVTSMTRSQMLPTLRDEAAIHIAPSAPAQLRGLVTMARAAASSVEPDHHIRKVRLRRYRSFRHNPIYADNRIRLPRGGQRRQQSRCRIFIRSSISHRPGRSQCSPVDAGQVDAMVIEMPAYHSYPATSSQNPPLPPRAAGPHRRSICLVNLACL